MLGVMRILHFIKGLGRGGAEMLLVHALRYADRDRFDYEYAYMLPYKDALVGELEANGAHVYLLPGVSKRELAEAPWKLARLVRSRDIDLIHAHLPVAGMVARTAGTLSRTPVLYTEHNLNEHYGRMTRWGNYLTWPLNHTVVAVSAPVAESIGKAMPAWSKVRVETVLNGIDVDEFEHIQGRNETRERLGIPLDATVVITVAVFRRQKRLDLWLTAASQIVQQAPNSHFIIVGDGPLRVEVESLRDSLGLRDRVHLTGLQEDVKPFLAAADLFMLTSDFEGLPLAVIEAMAAGLPVVSTRAGGVPDLVGEAANGADGVEAGGLLVDQGDVDACVAATCGLLDDRARREAVGEAACARVRREFSVERMVREYESLYEGVLNRQP